MASYVDEIRVSNIGNDFLSVSFIMGTVFVDYQLLFAGCVHLKIILIVDNVIAVAMIKMLLMHDFSIKKPSSKIKAFWG